MGIINKIFGGEKSANQAYHDAVEAEYKRMEKVRAKRGSRQAHINECVAVMKDCRTKFNQAITDERKIALKKNHSGIPTDRERNRIRDAAIGILTVDMALFDLESIKSEADLNAAMNQMGKALFQMIRLDQTNTNISTTSRSFIDLFYPSFKNMVEEENNYTVAKQKKEKVKRGEGTDIMAIYEIPKEIRDRIDDTFVDNLMQGDSYTIAMYKARMKPTQKTAEVHTAVNSDSTLDWDRINELAAVEDNLDLGSDSYGRSGGDQ